MTANGERILEFINNSTCHPTADDIYFALRAQGEKVSLATVYNNLATLSNEGKIKKLSFDGKVDRFDKIIRHDHLVCSKCGSVKDVILADLTNDIKQKVGEDVTSYELKIDYICEHCKKGL